MGYNTYVHGEIIVEPALSEALIKRLGLGRNGDVYDFVAIQDGTDDDVQLINGEITVVPGTKHTRIEPRFDEPFKAYESAEQLDKIMLAAKKAGHDANGAMYFDGEETRDFARIRVEHCVTHGERPKLVWPNGDEQQL